MSESLKFISANLATVGAVAAPIRWPHRLSTRTPYESTAEVMARAAVVENRLRRRSTVCRCARPPSRSTPAKAMAPASPMALPPTWSDSSLRSENASHSALKPVSAMRLPRMLPSGSACEVSHASSRKLLSQSSVRRLGR